MEIKEITSVNVKGTDKKKREILIADQSGNGITLVFFL
jgi:hypothetical protein